MYPCTIFNDLLLFARTDRRLDRIQSDNLFVPIAFGVCSIYLSFLCFLITLQDFIITEILTQQGLGTAWLTHFDIR